MLKWLKMGCGHLVAIPLLFFSFFSGLSFLSGLPNSDLQSLIELGSVALVTGGIGGGLLFYLWAQVGSASPQATEPAPAAEEGARPGGQQTRDQPHESLPQRQRQDGPPQERDPRAQSHPEQRSARQDSQDPETSATTGHTRKQEPSVPESEAIPLTLPISFLFLLVGTISLTVGVTYYLGGTPLSNLVESLGVGVGFIVFGILFSWRDWPRLLTWWRGVPDTVEEKPWTARTAWRTGDIPETEATEWMRVLIAGVFNVIAWPFTVFMLSKLQGMTSSDLTNLNGLLSALSGGNWIGYLIPLILPASFLVVAVYYGWLAIRDTLRWLRFGTSTLVINTMPARLGRSMRARLQTPIDPDDVPEEGVHVQLACYEPVRGTRSRRRRQLWQDSTYVSGQPAPRSDQGLEVPLSFDIPSSLPPSPPVRSSNRIQWEVQVHAELPGPDYEATFEIPVFEPDEG